MIGARDEDGGGLLCGVSSAQALEGQQDIESCGAGEGMPVSL